MPISGAGPTNYSGMMANSAGMMNGSSMMGNSSKMMSSSMMKNIPGANGVTPAGKTKSIFNSANLRGYIISGNLDHEKNYHKAIQDGDEYTEKILAELSSEEEKQLMNSFFNHPDSRRTGKGFGKNGRKI